MHDLLTTAEAAARLDTSERMIRHYVREKRLKPAKIAGRAHLFSSADVDALRPTLVRRDWSRQLGGGAPSVSAAFVLPPVLETGMRWTAFVVLGLMLLWGAQAFQEHRRRPLPVPPLALDERHAVAVADARCVADPFRGRVYVALGAEFWRSAFGQWLVDDGVRCVPVADRSILAALDAREGRGWVL